MSRPPLYPLLNKASVHEAFPVPQLSGNDTESHPGQCGHRKSVSCSSILEDLPVWLNDLLIDLDLESSSKKHRRAASGSLALFDGLVSLPEQDQYYSRETADSCDKENDLGSRCACGPNSPRRKNNLGLCKKEIVSAFSEHVMQNSLEHLDGYLSLSGALQADSFIDDAFTSAGELSNEDKQIKRHPGQRSRARKLQYIAELEKTVNILQNMGSELALRVASLTPCYAALSMENSSLKQQTLRVQKKKLKLDGQYQSLMNEAEILKARLVFSSNSARSDAVWNNLDLWKLDLK